MSTLDSWLVRRRIVDALKRVLPMLHGRLLDIGCGRMPYRPILVGPESRVTEYIGLDLETSLYESQPDLTWDGATIPLADTVIDCAIATEVLEHCPDPERVLHETSRVLKSGGVFFFTVPFLWPLHDAPYDYYRYTPFALSRLLDATGFRDIRIEPLGGWDASLAQVIGLWARRRPMRRWQRRVASSCLLPLVRLLVAIDRRPAAFASNTMITGLSGTAIKN